MSENDAVLISDRGDNYDLLIHARTKIIEKYSELYYHQQNYFTYSSSIFFSKNRILK